MYCVYNTHLFNSFLHVKLNDYKNLKFFSLPLQVLEMTPEEQRWYDEACKYGSK